jgi:hypothetical protein
MMGDFLTYGLAAAALAAAARIGATEHPLSQNTGIARPGPAGANLPEASKPVRLVWLTELSVGVKESYDDNVFLSGVPADHLPVSPVVPPGSVAALNNSWSWVTTVAPRAVINLAPLTGSKEISSLSFGYTPEFAFYHNEESESYFAHRLPALFSGKSGSVSWVLDNTFSRIDGSSVGPTYPGALLNAYAPAAPRERRDQLQDRGTVMLQYDLGNWFVRPGASLLYYDLMTRQFNSQGYQNYADRYDANGGADLGYRVVPQAAATLGYRYGHQEQEQFDFSAYSAPSDYHRLLGGFEIKPWKWLDLKLQAGPDFREYPDNSATHTTPLDEHKPITYYAEGSANATISPKSSLSLKYKQFQWVSSTGKVPYFDSTYDLRFRQKFEHGFSGELGARLLTADYNGGNLAACLRDDWQYTLSASVTYSVNAHANLIAGYAADFGRNAQADIPEPETRNYLRNLTSVGVNLKF